MRKVVFSAGLAISVVGGAFAGERSRGTSGDAVSVGTVEALAPVFQEIAPGVAKMSVGGMELTVQANGAVELSTVLAEYGSIERFQFEASVINSPIATAGDGARLFADGVVGYYSDLLGANSPVRPAITTAEEYKTVMGWTEMKVGADTVVAFADGAVFNDGTLASAPWLLHDSTVPSAINGEDVIFADGAVIIR